MCRLVVAGALSCFVFSLMLAGSAAAQCSPEGFPLVGEDPANWWPADGTTLDIVTGAEATLENGAGFEAGVVGQAFSFNGSVDQRVTVPDSRAWDFGTCDFSISLWTKLNADAWVVPLISHDEGGGNTNKWMFWVQPLDWGGGLVFHINSPTLMYGANVVGLDGFWPEPNRWYHFAVTRKGNQYTLYVNGLPVVSSSDSHKIPNAIAPLRIGQSEEAFALSGSIDEVKIYRRALSAAEVRTLGFMQGAASVPVQ